MSSRQRQRRVVSYSTEAHTGSVRAQRRQCPSPVRRQRRSSLVRSTGTASGRQTLMFLMRNTPLMSIHTWHTARAS
eukprot:15466186-Alexandrium_andersonii.AAC.1